MRSLNEVKDACSIITADDSDDGREHWIFKGACHEGSPRIHAPNYSKDPTGNTLTTQAGRRAVWHLVNKKALPKGWRVWANCLEPSCVNPACVGAGNLAAYGRSVVKSGKYRNVPKRMLANRRNTDLQRKITRAVADDILGSDESNIVLAARHSLHKETVSRVKRGKCKVPGNFFQGLMK